MIETSPSTTMRELGIIQAGAAILDRPARLLDLPAESDTATTGIEELFTAMGRVARVHPFAKGMGIAAPQIGIDHQLAVVRPANPDAPAIVLINPHVIAESEDTDKQYEGCLSFFDVRGLVPRPLHLTVETTTLAGEIITTTYQHGPARLIAHELDHLAGRLYTSRMQPGLAPIPVEQYKLTGREWSYTRQQVTSNDRSPAPEISDLTTPEHDQQHSQ